MKRKFLFIFIIVTVLFVAGLAKATVYLPSLPVGTYRIIFVTYTVYPATSTDIGWYNDQVYSAANSNQTLSDLGLDWRCVGSTEYVNARDNVSHGEWDDVPIYNTRGQKVGDNLADIFDGDLDNAVVYNEDGVDTDDEDKPGLPNVWTGSWGDGTSTSTPLGGNDYNHVTYGRSTQTDHWWLNDATVNNTVFNRRLYGISTTPEPATICLLGFGGLALRRRSRRRVHS